MISKIIPTGGSFYNTARYVCERQKHGQAQIIDASGVRIRDHTLMAMDFESQRQMVPDKKKAVFHGVLSFPSGENPGDALMVEIARKWMDGLEMKDTQYVIVRHTDTAHSHLHIIANFVNNQGEAIREGLNRNKGIVIARELTQEYKLLPFQEQEPGLINREKLYGRDAKKHDIREAINKSLLHCQTIEDLEKQIRMKGIETRYRVDQRTGERVGISFRLDKMAFKGSSIGREFSLPGLQRRLEEQQRLQLSQAKELSQANKIYEDQMGGRRISSRLDGSSHRDSGGEEIESPRHVPRLHL